MKKIIILIWLCASATLLTGMRIPPTCPHDVHTSMAKIEYYPHLHSINVLLNVFTDDIQSAILNSNAPHTINDSLRQYNILQYIHTHFTISINGKLATLYYRGAMHADMVSSFEFEILKVPQNLQSIAIHNTILHSLYSDQLNYLQLVDNDRTLMLACTVTAPVAAARYTVHGWQQK